MDKKKIKTEIHKYLQLVLAVIIIVGIVLLITTVINPMLKYSSAAGALDKGEYETAIKLFDELGDYKDSENLKEQAQTLLNNMQNASSGKEEIPQEEKETYYLRAQSYIDNGKYDKAAAILKQLGDYKNSAELLEKYKLYGLEPGDVMTLGRWYFDASGKTKDDITWTVVDVSDGVAVLLCDRILDCLPFDSNGGSAWDTSTIRTFLNGDFYNNVFNAEEKKTIAKKTTKTEENSEYGTKYGNDCADYVTIPSIQDFKGYMTKVEDKAHAKATDYALGKGLNEYTKTVKKDINGEKVSVELKGSWFWLRSAGFTKGFVSVCYSDGDISYGGQESDITLGIRPVIKINLTVQN